MNSSATITRITGRFTMEQLEHLAGTLAWSRGVPETVNEPDVHELHNLIRQAFDYIESTPNAWAVDIVDGQILNVITT